MLLNASYDNIFTPNASSPSADTLEAYYKTIFDAIGYAGKYDIVRCTAAPKYFPSLQVFSRYRSVFLFNEINQPGDVTTGITLEVDRLTQYLEVGGKMVNTAMTMANQVTDPFYAFGPHMKRVTGAPPFRGDTAFVGANGQKGYPDVRFDPAKTPNGAAGLAGGTYGQSVGFGEITYTFHESHCLPIVVNNQVVFCLPWEGRTVGVKYDGLVYKYVFFGFPLYYCDQPTVLQILTRAFSDIGE